MLSIILQDMTGIWSKLMTQGPVVILLAAAVFVLWKRDNTQQAQMDKYISEDRSEMLDVIKSNTDALKDNTRVTQDLKNVIDKLSK